MAICLQALVAAIQGDGRAAESEAERAEAIMPGDPEVLATTLGQVRVARGAVPGRRRPRGPA